MNKKEKNKRPSRPRAKYVCPTKLQELIALLNLVPPDAGLEPVSEIKRRVGGRYLIANGVNSVQELDERQLLRFLIDVVDECYKDFPKDYLDHHPTYYLRKGAAIILDDERWLSVKDLHPTFNKLIEDYENFREDRENLLKLAELIEERRKNKANGPFIFIPKSRDTATVLSAGEDHDQEEVIEVKRQVERFINAVTNIKMDRLRLCAICRKVYWAPRVETETCSLICANRLRQRRFYREKLRRKNNESSEESNQIESKISLPG